MNRKLNYAVALLLCALSLASTAHARRYDPETGLMYCRNRMYDPNLGRFISRDPIGLKDGMNLYTYVRNRPTNSVDPMGLSAAPLATLLAKTKSQSARFLPILLGYAAMDWNMNRAKRDATDCCDAKSIKFSGAGKSEIPGMPAIPATGDIPATQAKPSSITFVHNYELTGDFLDHCVAGQVATTSAVFFAQKAIVGPKYKISTPLGPIVLGTKTAAIPELGNDWKEGSSTDQARIPDWVNMHFTRDGKSVGGDEWYTPNHSPTIFYILAVTWVRNSKEFHGAISSAWGFLGGTEFPLATGEATYNFKTW